MASYTLNINNQSYTVDAAPNDYLLYILRDKLDLTGAKYGCGVAVCGACTCHSDTPIVASNGNGASPYDNDSRFSGTQPTTPRKKFRSCNVRVKDIGQRKITTIEGLKDTALGQKLIAAWKKYDVAQCGYCQAGQLMTAYELLERGVLTSANADETITNAMQANLCRCGTYPRIRAAIMHAAGLQHE